MKKERKGKHFIKKPVYQGGLSALQRFIKDHLQYPDLALTNKIEGTVFVKYTINYKGVVVEAKVLKNIGYGCGEEAIRLVKMLVFKTPKTRKIKVQFHKSIQIHFRLPKSNDLSSPQYDYIPSTKNHKSYTISIDF